VRMTSEVLVDQARIAVQSSFGWERGHADVWRVFRQPETLAAVVRGLAAPFAGHGMTMVIGVESRGFLLGAAVAVELKAGFVAVRKSGALFPGPKLRQTTDTTDYRGNRHELLLRTEDLRMADRVLLVDDWIETGSQARAVASMVQACGASLVGISVMVDQLDLTAKQQLPPVHALVTAAELSARAEAPR
jgi:adenine phosphoribosyltransferase